MLSLMNKGGWLVGTHSDGTPFDGKLTEADKAELRSHWTRKRERIVTDHAAPSTPGLQDLLDTIAHRRPARDFVVGTARDTNSIGPHLPSAHSVNADQVDAPNAKGASAHTAKIAQVVATAMRDPGVLVELATRAASVGGNDEVWFLASVIRDRGDSAKLGALCEQFFNGAQGGAAPGGEAPTPPVVPSSSNPTGRSPAESALPKANDSLEDFLPKRKNNDPSSLEGLVKHIHRKR
jgi:hypothetical protein